VKFTVQPIVPDDTVQDSNCTKEVTSKAICTVKVTFSPVAEGLRKGQLSITYQSDPDKKSPLFRPSP
jgi:hypothetical protein